MGFCVPKSWLRWLCRNKTFNNKKKRHIPMPNGALYLFRYYFTHPDDGRTEKDNGRWFGVFLHEYKGADTERFLHDHPWKWSFSVILRGAYVEEVLDCFDCTKPECVQVSRKEVKFFNVITKRKFHRIVAIVPGTWTLFFHGRRMKDWGFLIPLIPYQCLRYVQWESWLLELQGKTPVTPK